MTPRPVASCQETTSPRDIVCSLTIGVVLLSAFGAEAHLTYGSGATSRDFGSFTGLSTSSVSINYGTATGNFGWADAGDGILGDSHKGRAYRFALQNEASVNLTVSANPTATGTSVGGLIPGFSIYQGLAAISPFAPPQTDADHDGSLASIAWRNFYETANGLTLNSTDGNWNSMGDFKIGGDGDPTDDFSKLSSFSFKGFGVDPGTTGTATGTFTLPAGSYTIIVGGNDIANKSDALNSTKPYGIGATLTVSSVLPVPEPQTYALIAAGACMLGLAARRRSRG